MIRFETLLEKVRSYSPEADLELLRRAYVFSALEHKGQVRHSGEPYLVHPLEVADFLADMKLDVVAVAAGLLHDVVEDTLTTPERIAELFGPEIAHVVEGRHQDRRDSRSRRARSARPRTSARCCWRWWTTSASSSSSSPTGFTTCARSTTCRRSAASKIAQETLDIYAPIANRLGMSKVKNELEELSFRYLEPKAYEGLRAKVEAKRKSAEKVIDELTRTIRGKLEEAQVPVIHLDGRIKRLYSIHLKLKRQKIDLERVYDFVALRVITQSVKDCYAALGIIHQTWSPVPGRIKDFIAMPRPNGYQSLHTSVISEHGFPFEVQIRTEEMHRRAEEGIAAHWKYKEGRVGDHRDERYFQWMRQLLEVQQEVRDPQEFLQNLKIDLYPEEVYIFTPKGEVRSLPRGATAVDFAYSIHTDVGNQCVGARINGRMVPLRTRLQNGDIVEIVTQAGAQAKPRLARRSSPRRARAARSSTCCRARSARAASSSGGGCSRRRRARFDLNPKTVLESAELSKFASEYGAKAAEELLAHIGYGKLSARTVLQKARAAGGAQGEGRRTPPSSPSSSACCGPAAPRRTRSRCAAPTTCWCSARSAATRSAARRSSATSRAARACRCTRRAVRTCST